MERNSKVRTTSNVLQLVLFLGIALSMPIAHAQLLPKNFTIEGRFYDAGTGNPYNTTVDVRFEVVDQSNTSCVLYRETHAGLNVSSADSNLQGRFSIKLGSGTQNFLATGTTSLVDTFNTATMMGDGDSNNTPDCALTPVSGSERQVKIYVKDSGTPSFGSALSPNVTLTSVPGALVAETLQGKSPSAFLLVKDDASTDLNQTNLETVFSAVNFDKLSRFLSGTENAAYSMNNQRITNLGTPTASTDAATKGYADLYVGGKTADTSGVSGSVGDGATLIWDQTNNKWVTGTLTATDSTKLPLAGGTMTGTISMGGHQIYNVSHMTMASQSLLNLGTFTDVQEAALALGGPDAGKILFNTDRGVVRAWNGSSFTGFAPSGTAGGDLTGTYPSPSISVNAVTNTKIANDAITSAKINSTGIAANRLLSTSAATGTTVTYVGCAFNQVMTFDALGQWSCTTVASILPSGSTPGEVLKWNGSHWEVSVDTDSGGDITDVGVGAGLSGGGTSGSVTINLANTTVAASSYGSSSQVPTFTVDQQGRLTGAANLDIKIATSALNQTHAQVNQVLAWNGSAWLPQNDLGDIASVTAGTGLTGGGTLLDVTLSLADTAVTIGSYGSPSQIAQFTVDQQGRLTTASNQTIAIAATAITQTGAGVGQILKWNGSAWLPATESTASGDITDIAVGTGLTGGGSFGAVTVSLNNTPVVANSYGSPSQVATFTVDQQGRLTAAANQNITINPTALNQYAATSGQVLKWNGSAWLPGNDAGGIAALTGDVSASGTGTVTAIIGDNKVTSSKLSTTGIGINRLVISDATTGTNLGFASCGVDGQVLKYSAAGGWACSSDAGASGVLTQIDTGTGLSGGPINTAGTISLANTAVTVGTYGSASSVGQFSVDKQGRLFAATSLPVAINPTAINQYTATAGQILKWNGSAWLPATDTDSGGDITDITVGAGLTGGGVSGAVTVSLNTTTVTIGSYGSPSQVSTFTVDQQGRLTIAGNQSIAINPTAINQYTATAGQILKWNGSAWLPATDVVGAGTVTKVETGTGLSGGPISTAGTISLANTAVTVGTYGSASSVGQFSVDKQGRLFAATSLPVAINPTAINQYAATAGQILKWNGSAWLPAADVSGSGTVTTVATGTGLTGGPITSGGTISLANTTITIGSYGTGSQVPVFSVDQQGRLTSANNLNIAINPTAINQYTATSGQVLKWNGSAWLPATDVVGAGTVTKVETGTGLTGGPITSGGTISVDTGIGANQIPKFDTNGSLGIGTATVATGAALDIYGNTSTNSSIIVPRATSGTRPTTGVNGMIRYNTTNARFEAFENGLWVNMIGGASSSSLSSLTAATATNSIDNGSYNQTWNYTGLGASAGFSLVGSNGTIGAVLQVINASTTGTGYAARMSVPQTGSGATVLYIQNNGSGDSFRVDDSNSDPTPFLIDNAGNVSTGGNLTTSGQLNSVSNWNTTAGASSVDFNTGNVQGITSPPTNTNQTITLTNLTDGGSYVVILKSTVASQQFDFSGCTGRWNPALGPTSSTAGGYYIYNILYVNAISTCFVTWSGPF